MKGKVIQELSTEAELRQSVNRLKFEFLAPMMLENITVTKFKRIKKHESGLVIFFQKMSACPSVEYPDR